MKQFKWLLITKDLMTFDPFLPGFRPHLKWAAHRAFFLAYRVDFAQISFYFTRVQRQKGALN